VKKVKPNFKTLGPKYGKLMKPITAQLTSLTAEQIVQFERDGAYRLNIEGTEVEIGIEDVEIITDDIPGWLISSSGNLTVALDITLTDELRSEGLARELVNRIQNIRKEKKFEVTDKISVVIEKNNDLELAVKKNYTYICSETLAESLQLTEKIVTNNKIMVELTDDMKTNITIEKQYH
jgi:isoleucyl-tRNA synthetase